MSDVSDHSAPIILVVEDDDLIGDLVESYLDDLGLSILRAANAAEAIDTLNDHNDISLVFSDIVMPGSMDGFGLARWIGAHCPKVRVLLTSGYWGRERPGLELDAASLLPKPYRLDELRRRVVSLLTGPQLIG